MKMLVIRETQLDEFAKYFSTDFELAITGHIKTAFPTQFAAWGEAQTTAFVRRNMRRARHCGIDSFGTLTTFFELLLQFGEQFGESPNGDKALRITRNSKLPGQVKVQLLTETLHGPAGGRPLTVVA